MPDPALVPGVLPDIVKSSAASRTRILDAVPETHLDYLNEVVLDTTSRLVRDLKAVL